MPTRLDVSDVRPGAQAACDPRCVPAMRVCRSSGAALDDAVDWVARHRELLATQLAEAGAILFRGFPLTTPEDFDAFVQGFDYPNFRYQDSLSNAVRAVRTERVFSANEAPASVQIHLHHEMAQTPIFPQKLLFFCEIPAETGGATPLCRSDLLFERLTREAPRFAADCERKGLKYTNVMPGADDPASGMGRSWRSTLRATDREAAEMRLRALGYTWEWLDDDCLRATTPVLPAVWDLGEGRKSFFNQLIAAACGWKDARNDPSRAITYGDAEPLDRQGVLLAVELGKPLTFDVAWQAGDVALVDNMIMMHARRPFTGTRKVWASLVAADEALRIPSSG
jgi:hypothetical protein